MTDPQVGATAWLHCSRSADTRGAVTARVSGIVAARQTELISAAQAALAAGPGTGANFPDGRAPSSSMWCGENIVVTNPW
jgi:hypothetical protein